MKKLLYLLILLSIQACTDSAAPTTTMSPTELAAIDSVQKDRLQPTITADKDSFVLGEKRKQLKPIQSFSISQNQNNILQGREGTILIIPKDCFVDKTDKIATGNIKLELIEAYSLADIIENQLETSANNGLLITGGMLKVTASKADGQDLAIAKGKTIRIKAAVDRDDYQFFELKDGLWQNPQPQNPYLTYKNIENMGSASCQMIENTFNTTLTSSISYLPDSIQKTVHKTYLASKEFEERFRLVGCHEGTAFAKRIYLNNLSKPLWQVDSMVVEQFKEMPNSYSDKLISTFTAFKNQYKTTLDPSLRLSDKDMKQLESYEAILKKQKADNEAAIKKQKVKNIVQYNMIGLGWRNIDCYYEQPVKRTNLLVTSQQPIQNICLILKEAKVLLSRQFSNNNNTYTFKQNLPQLPAYLVAMSEKDGQLFLAKKEILIGQNKKETLELKPSTLEELEKVLAEIEKGY